MELALISDLEKLTQEIKKIEKSNNLKRLDELHQLILKTDDLSIRDSVAIVLSDLGDKSSLPILINVIENRSQIGYRDTLIWSCEGFDCSAYLVLFSSFLLTDSFSAALSSGGVILEMKGPFKEQELRMTTEMLWRGLSKKAGSDALENDYLILDVLLFLTKFDNPDKRESSTKSLEFDIGKVGSVADKSDLNWLKKIAETSPDEVTRNKAVFAIARIENLETFSAIRSLVQDSTPKNITTTILWTCHGYDFSSELETVGKFLESDNPTIVNLSLDLVDKMRGPIASAHVSSFMKHLSRVDDVSLGERKREIESHLNSLEKI